MSEIQLAETIAEIVYAATDVVHLNRNLSYSRTQQILVVNADGGGILDLADITNLADDELERIGRLSGEQTMNALADHIYWSRP